MAVTEPTIGCRQDADRGYALSKSTVQKILVNHGLGRRAQRVALAAAVAAATTGLISAAADRLFGFCPWAARPGDLVGPGQLLHRQPQGA